MIRSLMVAWLGALMFVAPMAAQQARISSGPLELVFSGRVQVQYSTTSVGEDETGDDSAPVSSTFETRRVRMAVELTLADWITGTVEPDFANGRVQLRQAWVGLGFSPMFGVRAGQYKKPFSLIQLTSSTKTPMIERAVRIRGLADALAAAGVAVPEFDGAALLGEEQQLLEVLGYDAYDLGASAYGTVGRFGYEAGIFNGGAGGGDENGAKSLAGRATYRAGAVTLGAGVSMRDYVEGTASERGTALGADVEYGGFRKPGLWLLAEAAAGDNLVGGEFRGVQGVATWYVPRSGRVEGIEPVLRVSWGDPDADTDGDTGTLLTPGVNLHLYGRNKVSLNWDWYLPQAAALSAQHALRAQLQLYY